MRFLTMVEYIMALILTENHTALAFKFSQTAIHSQVTSYKDLSMEMVDLNLRMDDKSNNKIFNKYIFFLNINLNEEYNINSILIYLN